MSFLGNIRKEINRRHAERQQEQALFKEAYRKAKLQGIQTRASREGKLAGLGKGKPGLGHGVLKTGWGQLVKMGERATVNDTFRAKKPQKIRVPSTSEILYGTSRPRPTSIIGIRKKKQRNITKNIIIRI